jgi:hypothetical protein
MHQFTGPEPACGIAYRVAVWIIRDWMCRAPRLLAVHLRTKTKNSSLSNVTAKVAAEFLKLNRSQATQVTGLLAEHLSFKGSPPQARYN